MQAAVVDWIRRWIVGATPCTWHSENDYSLNFTQTLAMVGSDRIRWVADSLLCAVELARFGLVCAASIDCGLVVSRGGDGTSRVLEGAGTGLLERLCIFCQHVSMAGFVGRFV